ncbi:MAG TPA: cytidine deaminase, partial [Flavobacteriales bacterium]|nr:cytidine deaminase [Flavobacteriales bacterium]
TRKIALHYLQHPSWASLPAEDRKLLELATRAARNAYAPYSKFLVGAALCMEDGHIVPGNNQENASFPAGICAERTALHAARAVLPKGIVESMAIVVPKVRGSRPVTPCGICRQALVEQERRQKSPIRLLMGIVKGPVIETFSAETLLPLSFDSSYLTPARKKR